MLEYLPEKAIVSLPSPDSKCTHTDHSFLLIYVSNNTVKVEEYEIWNKKCYGHYPRIIHTSVRTMSVLVAVTTISLHTTYLR